MFDFQKLEVYQKSKKFCVEVTSALSEMSFDKVTNDQLRRAPFSIMLNIAEGSSRFSNKDRKNIIVRFIIDSEGKVKDAVISKGVHPALDSEALISQAAYRNYQHTIRPLVCNLTPC